LVGVYSESTDTPLKTAGFALRDKTLLDKESYSEWVFRSALPAANPVLSAGQGYGTSGGPVAPRSPAQQQPRPNNTPPPPGVILPTPRTR
jgi:hypothetical protein